jgi:hypothetical protein
VGAAHGRRRQVAAAAPEHVVDGHHARVDGWEELRAGVEGDAGWPLYLARYAEQVAPTG